jgi:hypothetical protein
MTRTLNISIPEFCTIKLALTGWGVRCQTEADRMNVWAVEYDAKGERDLAVKCRANAAASLKMKAEAEATLARIR